MPYLLAVLGFLGDVRAVSQFVKVAARLGGLVKDVGRGNA